jgi:aryl-alcohol dehydrogenase-like predicted oxidoreductase
MHYRQLGHSGLLVSEIILATKGRSPVDKNPNNSGSTRHGHRPPANTRQGSDWPEPYVHDQERALDIIETLAAAGDEHGVSVARTCLAWLKDRPGITSLIVGARTEAHLRDNLARDAQLFLYGGLGQRHQDPLD